MLLNFLGVLSELCERCLASHFLCIPAFPGSLAVLRALGDLCGAGSVRPFLIKWCDYHAGPEISQDEMPHVRVTIPVTLPAQARRP